VLEDLAWEGVPLRRGTKVGLLFGSANRDEARFDRPDELVLDRVDNPHVSFGGGIHFCVGAPLARVELEVALRSFVEHVTEFSLANDTLERVPSLVFRGVKRLPITLSG
jgi:cytochrome P450